MGKEINVKDRVLKDFNESRVEVNKVCTPGGEAMIWKAGAHCL